MSGISEHISAQLALGLAVNVSQILWLSCISSDLLLTAKEELFMHWSDRASFMISDSLLPPQSYGSSRRGGLIYMLFSCSLLPGLDCSLILMQLRLGYTDDK